MQYFIAWTHSDPIYHQLLPDLPALVSPPNVSLSWSVAEWPTPPPALIVDSGAFQYHRSGRTAEPTAVLSRQLQIIAGQAIPAAICHLDVPLLGTRSLAELDRRVNRSLSNARWLMDHIEQHRLPPDVEPIAVIQGYSVDSVYTAARALADMGYTTFAVGSLAGLSAHSQAELLRRVEAALEAVGPGLHILGVSSVKLLRTLSELGVRSADSSAPMREAWRGGIMYSRPFRRYKLPTAYFAEWARTYTFSEILPDLEPCECPVCLDGPERLLEPRGKQFINLRAIHNCYHLRREISPEAA